MSHLFKRLVCGGAEFFRPEVSSKGGRELKTIRKRGMEERTNAVVVEINNTLRPSR